MDTHIETATLLSVFQKVLDNGERVDGKSRLDGISASTDYDGYTVFLEDAKVKMTVFFHNTRQTDYESKSDLEKFCQKIKRIDQSY